MAITRVRGDNYPIEAIIQVNGVAVNLLVGDVITFTYLLSGGTTPVTIAGTITDAENGIVSFYPSGTDFTTVGSYAYDIQRVSNGIKTTHIIDKMKITDDINKG
jgi:hypothetical protein